MKDTFTGKESIMSAKILNTVTKPVESRATPEPFIKVCQVTKIYETSSGPFTALRQIDLQVRSGEFLAIIGKSGSGKSTLMNLITGIDSPSGGEIWLAGTPIHALSQQALTRWRGKNIGIVFQFFQLLPTLTVVENIMLPMDFCHTYPARERRDRALALLERVGIAEQANKLPASLSGGQQQRAAISRALANDPLLIAADEPTGNLDSHTSQMILELFSELRKEGKTILMVTHERDVTRYITQAITLADGMICQAESSATSGCSKDKGGQVC